MSNELSKSLSPYLLMHADDPVDWRMWSDDTLRLAREKNRLIFLSIGYSSCHWCHVMHDESFMDNEIASILNNDYIPIKVDREERPDLDSYFMKVSQVINGNGGWPLNIILLPDGRPIFAMTYVPKEDRNGMTGLKNILLQLSAMYAKDPDQFKDQAKAVSDAMEERASIPSKLTGGISDRLYESISRYLDRIDGGFSGQTKFYNVPVLEFLMDRYETTHDRDVAEFLETTMKTIAIRGVHDPLFGGFFRYSTDSMWIIPHFEKMSYTQAQLMRAYAKMHLLFHDDFYAKIVEDIYRFMDGCMYSGRSYYTSVDADYKGEEGGHYLFDFNEIRDSLGDDFTKFVRVYEVKENGNFSDTHGENKGRNFLYFSGTYKEFSELMSDSGVRRSIVAGLQKLRKIREKDDVFIDRKELVDINSMIVSALAWAYRSTLNGIYLERARVVSGWLRDLNRERVSHGMFNGRKIETTTLQDYAFLSQAMIDMFQITFDYGYLEDARRFADQAMSLLKDGRLSYSSEISESDPMDGEVESPYAVLTKVLDQISLLADDMDLHERSGDLLASVFGNVQAFPAAYPSMVRSAEFHLKGKHVSSNRAKIEDLMRSSVYHNTVFSLQDTGAYIVCGYGMCFPPSGSVEDVASQINS
ncbi:thioredoxin domain-containing protein [Thermoplasma sp.]|uniref:thioredoxin domain-containing protein n=1 Tax=Thermoplasma sp. TaxID=1973142 RepID=UPI00127BC810|nr:thioredoxin domain-containing protein [Thermoplasma sp.]KAA8923048.1 MAG: thioredoxin domain-containing protein [Thermoplasma sp.]